MSLSSVLWVTVEVLLAIVLMHVLLVYLRERSAAQQEALAMRIDDSYRPATRSQDEAAAAAELRGLDPDEVYAPASAGGLGTCDGPAMMRDELMDYLGSFPPVQGGASCDFQTGLQNPGPLQCQDAAPAAMSGAAADFEGAAAPVSWADTRAPQALFENESMFTGEIAPGVLGYDPHSSYHQLL